MRVCRTDINQKDIMRDLKKIGASVQSLHTVGEGCPDLLVGYRGYNYPIELKIPGGKLRDRQIEWFDDWKGTAYVADSFDAVLEIIQCGAAPSHNIARDIPNKWLSPKQRRERERVKG